MVVCSFLCVYTAYTIFLIVMKGIQGDRIAIGLEIANLCFRSLKFITDLYMHFLFLSLLNFIVKIKKKNADEKLTIKNKLMISWIILLWCLSFIQALQALVDSIGDFL